MGFNKKGDKKMKLKDLLTGTDMEHCKIRIIEVRPKPLHNIDIAYLYDFTKYQIKNGIVQDYLDFKISKIRTDEEGYMVLFLSNEEK